MSILRESVKSLISTYRDFISFTTRETLSGVEYSFGIGFVSKLKIVLKLETLSIFNAEERAVWDTYILWQEKYHYSVPLGNNGIGCTTDTANNSFVVAEDGQTSTAECVPPAEGMTEQEVQLALAVDALLLQLLNCSYEELEQEVTVILTEAHICEGTQ